MKIQPTAHPRSGTKIAVQPTESGAGSRATAGMFEPQSLEDFNKHVDLGKPYSVSTKAGRNGGQVLLRLPHTSLYSWAMFTLLNDRGLDGEIHSKTLPFADKMYMVLQHVLATYAPLMILMALALWMQFELLTALAAMAVQAKDERMAVAEDLRPHKTDFCLTSENGWETNQSIIRVICLLVALFPTINAIGESGRMVRWLFAVPAWSEEKHRAIYDELGNEFAGALLFQSRRINYQHHFKDGSCKTAEVKVEQFATGITYLRRMSALLVCILPKLFMELLMLFSGSGFVLTSGTTADLILNCLAVNFILDIDDVMFNVLVVQSAKTEFQNVPAIGLWLHRQSGEARAWRVDRFFQLCGTWVVHGALALLHLFFFSHWCTDLDDMTHMRDIFQLHATETIDTGMGL